MFRDLEELTMISMRRAVTLAAAVGVLSGTARADNYEDAISLFKHAGQSATYFDKSYAYAVFPTVGKGGFVVGAAHGDGHVYSQHKWVGNTSVTQVSVGFQAGGEAYSEIIFFQDKRALDEFESGNFTFGADVGVTAITASANAGASTQASGASASGGEKDARTAGGYYKGMAVFTITKGGLMYDATLAGQKFTFTPRGA
jgi:lipid-binding SYLF domain-containing protein